MGLRAFQPFVPESARFLSTINFYQTNNTFVADQLTAQFQNIEIANSAFNASINISAGQNAINLKVGG